MLRNFSYLDTDALNQYLAQLEGSVGGNHAERTTTKRGGSVGAAYQGVGAQHTRQKETEVSQNREIPAAGMFQHLHDLLTSSGDIQCLDAFDDGIWRQLERGEFLEVQATIRLPEYMSLIRTLPAIGQVLGVMERLSETTSVDPEFAEQYKALLGLTSGQEEQALPIVFEATSTPGYTFAGKLRRNCLLVEAGELEGEAVVIGKILRLLPPGREEDFASITPEMENLFRFMNRQQRRATREAPPPSVLVEKLHGPAAVLGVLAVFT